MKIHNFRIGFATNSSSSHSVVLIPPHLIGNVADIAAYDETHYGWDYFRLASEEEKLRYLAAQMFSSIRSMDNPDIKSRIIARFDQEMPGFADNMRDLDEDYGLPSVDHQSVYRFSADTLTDKFMDQLIRFFKSDRVVVLGGNDNSDNIDRILPNESEIIPRFNDVMTRVKIEGDYWTFFNSNNGTKARITLDANAPDYVKSITPELVDLKITNYCGRGCKFCYQSSTTEGQHAPLNEIIKMLDMLAEMEVFEVALGGGEPTDHPQFVEILDACVARNIRPNFTTQSEKWLSDARIVAAVLRNVGGIGVSCSDKKALQLVADVHRYIPRYSSTKVMAQHVVGSVPLPVTAEFMDAAFAEHIPVLLLGYKEVGFGAQFSRMDDPVNTPLVLKLAMDNAAHRWPQLSVDTALVDQFPTFIETLGIPDALVTSPEGKFSCYIDAVERLFAPSSYVEKSEMQLVPETVEGFKKAYAEF